VQIWDCTGSDDGRECVGWADVDTLDWISKEERCVQGFDSCGDGIESGRDENRPAEIWEDWLERMEPLEIDAEWVELPDDRFRLKTI